MKNVPRDKVSLVPRGSEHVGGGGGKKQNPAVAQPSQIEICRAFGPHLFILKNVSKFCRMLREKTGLIKKRGSKIKNYSGNFFHHHSDDQSPENITHILFFVN